jgi:hypothetical protein
VAAAGASVVNVSWLHPASSRLDVSHYVVVVFDAAANQNVFNVSTSDDSCVLAIDGVTNGVSYYFEVVAVDVADESSMPSSPSDAVTPCARFHSPPDAPRSVNMTGCFDCVEVTWVPSSMTPCWADAISAWNITYELQQPAGVRTVTVVAGANVTSLLITNLSRSDGMFVTAVMVSAYALAVVQLRDERTLLCLSLTGVVQQL